MPKTIIARDGTNRVITFNKPRPFDIDRAFLPSYAVEKLDGNRVKIVDGCVYTTLGHNIAGLPTIQRALARFPKDHEFDCELCVEGQPAEYVKTALAQDEDVQLRPFASDTHEESDTAEFIRWCEKTGLNPPWVYTLSGVGDDEHERWTWLLDAVEKLDIEGWVFSDSHRGVLWKWKRTRTIDLIVTDTILGEGKFLGLVGALVCETTEGVEVCHASGMTDVERVDMTLDDDVIGKVVEVKYDRVGTQGRLRHPRFKRWRSDKSVAECGLDQDSRLEEFWNARLKPKSE